MAASLTIRLLGPFNALVDGRPADVTGPKRCALVALLALHRGRFVSVDAIVEAIWGAEELPADPANAVQHHVTRLRKALGPDALVVAADGYQLRGADVDVLRFEELLTEARAALRAEDARAAAAAAQSALDLWAGTPFQGLPEADWVATEQARLEALRLDLLEERFDALLALGEHATLVPELRDALALNPYRERLWRQLMLALYRAGRQADSLDAFQEARRILSDDLGLEPGPELQRLQTAILAQDPSIAAVPVPRGQRGNVPAAVTSFVGREALLAEVQQLVREQRLVTLTGPPGVGKTRLALEAARVLQDELEDGVWVVDLRRANAAEDVARLMATIVEAGSSPAAGDPAVRVVQRLRDARALLVVDECERFAGDVGRLVSRVLAECPHVRVLATSREPLRVPGEHRLSVEPLRVPVNADGDGAALASEAVQLFVERARAVRAGFDVAPHELQRVAEICRAVDGLPAAIELAAARANVLGLREILASTERWLSRLREGALAVEAADYATTLVGWSYDLLHADEKALLHQLAVFRGGADLDALLRLAIRLELDEATVTHLLAALVDKSVVTVSFPNGVGRYDLLTTVREYALDRLADAGELEATKRAHAHYVAELAEQASAGLRGPEWQDWIRRLALENDNLWAALAFAREAPDPDVAIRLGASLGLYFIFGDRISEGLRFSELALAASSDDAPRSLLAELLAYLSYFATESDRLDTALESAERALALADGVAETALGRLVLSAALARRGAAGRAATVIREAIDAYEAAGDDWGAAMAAATGGWSAAAAGDVEAVASLAAIAARHSEAIDYLPGLVPAALLEGWVAERRGDLRGAEEGYRRAVELAQRAGFTDHGSFAQVRLAETALVAGDTDGAEQLAREALATAGAAQAPAAAAHARAQLARVLAARGDLDGAAALYRSVLEWAGTQRARLGRETLFDALGGSPAAAASTGLAAVVDAQAALEPAP